MYNDPLRLFFKHHLINLTTELGIHFRPPFLKNKYLKARHNVGLQKPSCRNVVAVYAVFVFIGNLRAKLFCTVINIRIYVACFGRVDFANTTSLSNALYLTLIEQSNLPTGKPLLRKVLLQECLFYLM